MDNLMGMKELYDVVLKATYPIELGSHTIQEGEVLARFDNIMLADFNEIKKRIAACGGYDNRGLVWWEETEQVTFNFSQGIFSKTQMALVANAKLLKNEGGGVVISKREVKSTDENGNFDLLYAPVDKIFVYNKRTGEKVDYIINEDSSIHVDGVNEVIVDYDYKYDNDITYMIIGQNLISGFLTLEGKTRLKDDTTGHVITGIIKIPKVKLMSDLSIRLGKNATPTVAHFSVLGLPTGSKGTKKVMEFIYLEDDIDADI